MTDACASDACARAELAGHEVHALQGCRVCRGITGHHGAKGWALYVCAHARERNGARVEDWALPGIRTRFPGSGHAALTPSSGASSAATLRTSASLESADLNVSWGKVGLRGGSS